MIPEKGEFFPQRGGLFAVWKGIMGDSSVLIGKDTGGDLILDKIQKHLFNIEKRKQSYRKDKSDREEFFVFRLGKENLGINFRYVISIRKKYSAARLFKMPEQLEGIFGFRGEILALFSLGKLLGIKEDSPEILMVFHYGELTIGCRIDSVESIRCLPAPVEFQPLPESAKGYSFMDGMLPVENENILRLDVKSLFESQDVRI